MPIPSFSELYNALLGATLSGKFSFIWAAVLSDGTEIKQFNDELFYQLLRDDAPVPANLDDIRVSVDKLDVRKVKEFYLFPTGVTKGYMSHVQPVRLVVNLEQGEKFISYWLVDSHPATGKTFYRHVIGISKPVNGAQAKFFAIINPIGRLTVATSDDQSYEGE